MKFEIVNGEAPKPEEKMYLRLKELSSNDIAVEIGTDPLFTVSNNLVFLELENGKLAVRLCGHFDPRFKQHIALALSGSESIKVIKV